MLCVCGKKTSKSIDQLGIDFLEDREGREYKEVCEHCFKRIKKLREKLIKFADFGVDYEVCRYNGFFELIAMNVTFGDRASISEKDCRVKAAINNIYTGETVFLEDNEFIGVL